MMFTNPDDAVLKSCLLNSQRIAVVGLSPNPARPSHEVSSHMLAFGYDIVPVRPAVASVLGQAAYPSLQAVPGRIDLVNVFRQAAEVDAIVDDCIAMRIPAIWIQQGIINEPAAKRAQQAGMLVVMGRCIYVDYLRLIGRS
ncbi:hypothetical protein HNQ59_002313 [Chitinivorax tropicus]|uniref:CoA-binding domain-containing protein n=1 Tax=Chitinivorax tropicus TaxID=714531 RepID=A0A840MNH0_9PROT|nr:CoA-binding protein [Chitinivorax tropicus]MBB5019015.1 hypothetical protein [Chitinivorax tropicus]